MNNRNYDCIIIISVISGLFITTCDYLVQMKTVETDYFVSRLLSLEETILNLSSFGCIFTFPFWILGTYFIYTTMCKVNKKLALINTFCISYSLLILGFYHYSYAIIYSIGTSKMIMQTNIDWQLLTGSNIPFFPFMFILLPVTWLIVGFSNFSSKAIVPRWSIVVNPVILTIIYNPQIQISVVSGTKRSIFRQKNKTKRSKKRLHTTLIKPEQKVNEDLCSGFIVS